jgi:hypothetical protein
MIVFVIAIFNLSQLCPYELGGLGILAKMRMF